MDEPSPVELLENLLPQLKDKVMPADYDLFQKCAEEAQSGKLDLVLLRDSYLPGLRTINENHPKYASGPAGELMSQGLELLAKLV
tara:strand:- start:599 stop:853 length:255 start_codon:yes stop_codon:yes gene_type:complete